MTTTGRQTHQVWDIPSRTVTHEGNYESCLAYVQANTAILDGIGPFRIAERNST